MSERASPRTAIALEYQHPGVPRVTAKGQGIIAEKIIETARAAGVAVEENPALAEALAHVQLDDEIPDALYKAVAQVIVFVLRASGRIPVDRNGSSAKTAAKKP